MKTKRWWLFMAVLFFRLFESLCSSDSSNQSQFELRAPDDEDDECRSGLSSVASLAGSPSSSQWSLVKAGTGELDEDDIVSVSYSRQNSVFLDYTLDADTKSNRDFFT